MLNRVLPQPARTVRARSPELAGLMSMDGRDSTRSVDQDPVEVLRSALERDDRRVVSSLIASLPREDLRRMAARLSPQERGRLLDALEPGEAADFLEDLPDEDAASLLEEAHPSHAAAIVDELASDDRADVLAEMDEEDVATILANVSLEHAREARELMAYGADTAGGLMVKEFIAYPVDTTVEDVLEDLRQNAEEYAGYSAQYFYVTDADGRLLGVLGLRELVLSPRHKRIGELMLRAPIVLRDHDPLDKLQEQFEVHGHIALPVVSADRQLLGVVLAGDVAEAAGRSAGRMMLKFAGIFGGEESRSMPLAERVWKRLSWLVVNLGLNLAGASVIAIFEETLASVIALAVFLPIVSNISGNAGIQSIALSLRELTLGTIRPRDAIYVLSREAALGAVNAALLGVLVAGLGYVWKGSGWLGLVVGLALAVNTLAAGCLGGILPLLFRRVGIDPATASGPILTTIADMSGFFLVLGTATLLLSRLP